MQLVVDWGFGNLNRGLGVVNWWLSVGGSTEVSPGNQVKQGYSAQLVANWRLEGSLSIVLQLLIQWRFSDGVVGGEIFPLKGSGFPLSKLFLMFSFSLLLFSTFPFCYLLVIVFSCFVLDICNLVNHLYLANCKFYTQGPLVGRMEKQEDRKLSLDGKVRGQKRFYFLSFVFDQEGGKVEELKTFLFS